MRPIKSGPLTNLEIEELDTFLLSDDGLENAMDVSSLDGFLCAVLSGPNVILPSKWIPWVWDSTEANQSPEFTSEKQAQRILDLLMQHANDIAVTLTQFPQYYEPLFLERDHKGRTVSIVDEWCCGYVKGIALDPSGWKPFIEEHPDWFEVIHLYGTESGWDRLKESVEAYQDADARHQGFVELIAPAARNIHAYWLARRPCAKHHRRYVTTDSQGARSRPQRPMPLWLREEVQTLPWSTKIVALICGTRNSLPPVVLTQASTAACCVTPVQSQKIWKTAAFAQFQFFDPTGWQVNRVDLNKLIVLLVVVCLAVLTVISGYRLEIGWSGLRLEKNVVTAAE